MQFSLKSDKFCNLTANHGPSSPKPLLKSMKPRLCRHLFSGVQPISVTLLAILHLSVSYAFVSRDPGFESTLFSTGIRLVVQ